ncbi:MAG TPA: ABC transporter permease [Bryobacteraceae bacterium]|nr:ABC transporter permease [Bryobacteraceae bacterium]
MGKRFEKRLDREMRFHLDAATQAYIDQGLPNEEARRRAQIDFGALELAKDEMRDLHPLRWMEEIGRDIRYAGRQLRRSPAFTITVLLTLALCIGANTAMFSIVDQVFFQALPYPDPGRLMMIVRTFHKGNLSDTNPGQSFKTWQPIRDHATLLESAVYSDGSSGVNLFANDHGEYIQRQEVSAGYFHVLGIHPLIGREFTRQEDIPGGPALAVLGYAVWQRIFHGDSAILGRSIDLAGAPYTVIAVMPKGFKTDAAQAQIWTSLQPSPNGKGSGSNYEILARLKPNVTAAKANAQLASISQAVAAQFHIRGDVSFALNAIPLQTGRTLDARPKVRLMWAAAGLILLIGCINIAGLLLARSATRSREIATRLALGGTRRGIVAQLFTESVLLALFGGGLGFLLAYFALQGMNTIRAAQFSLTDPLQLNLPVLLVTGAISLLAAVIFGLFPALEATAINLRSSLAESGRGGTASRRLRKRQILVFAEVAVGVVLVVSAGLLLRSLSNLLHINPGFDPKNVVTASLSLQDARYRTSAATMRLFRDSLQQMRQIPGVESGAVALSLPYERALNLNIKDISGNPVKSYGGLVNYVYATPSYFETLRIPILRGRFFTDRDNAGAPKVAVVDQALVNFYLPNTPDPLGRQINLYGGSKSDALTIVGVINDIPQQQGWSAQFGPLARLPQMWVPVAQLADQDVELIAAFMSPSWVVRTRGNVPDLEQKMRQAILTVDPRLPFSAFHTVDELRSGALTEQRYQAMLFSAFAGLAILLCALGVYGLIAQSVAQRTREFGIRLALGASTKNIIRSAVLPGITLSVAGIACGIVLSLLATRLLKSLIWGVTTTDATTFITVSTLLIAVAVFASLIPALRLLKLDPAQTLRDE